MTPFERLGKDVASALRPGPGQRQARQLTALLAEDWRGRRRRSQAAMVMAVVACTVLIAVGVRGGFAQVGRAVAAFGGDVEALELAGDPALHEGRWLQVPADRALELAFVDGTEFRLERESTGRLALLSSSEARLTLEAGELAARVRPANLTGRAWSFAAGPYRVVVIGTELQVKWDARASRFSVYLREGRVQVRGGPLEPAGILLASGDRLEVHEGRIEIERAGRATSSIESEPPIPSASARELPRPAEVPVAAPRAADESAEESHTPKSGTASGAAGSAVAVPSAALAVGRDGRWMPLARGGDYRGALISAEREGFDALVERLNAADLALLADAARLAGNGARARQALLGLRRRYPGVSAAQTGAFRLGRLAFAERNYAEAATWFDSYLRAAPNGALASEAAGRLIEARARAGDRAGAEAAARNYLRRFPGGPYEGLARGLLKGAKLAPK